MAFIESKGDENTFLIYRNKILIGVIEADKINRKTIFQAYNKNGRYLGQTPTYGKALELITSAAKVIYHTGDD